MSKNKPRSKKKSISQLKKKADQVFSKWIRKRDSRSGFNTCVTCGKTALIEELQCGHYESRKHNATRYREDNCHCQCPGCNVFQHGNMAKYSLWIDQRYGPNKRKELRREAQKIKQFTRTELEEIIEKYS